MRKCIAFILVLLLLTALVVSCTDNNVGKENKPNITVTDDNWIVEDGTNDTGSGTNETTGDTTDTTDTNDDEETTAAPIHQVGGVDTSDRFGPLIGLN